MFLLCHDKIISALLIVSSWAVWSFGCSKCQFNESSEQEIIENPTRAVYNVYNESFKYNESNGYDQYDNQYEQYHPRYAEYTRS